MKKYIATFAICLGLAYGAAATAADLGNGISAGADLDEFVDFEISSQYTIKNLLRKKRGKKLNVKLRFSHCK